MNIRFYKPTSNGTRHRSVSQFIGKMSFMPKRLYIGYHRSKGRNNRGVITSRQRGGGQRRLYRYIDFKRNFTNMYAKVVGIHYDPNRNARLALLTYQNNVNRYIICPHMLSIGDSVIATDKAPIQVGNALPLSKIPLGTPIHNIELKPGQGGKLVRAAGATAQIIAKEGSWASVRLPSDEVRIFSVKCWATIGQVSNLSMSNTTLGKAGINRWKGKRPHVRGSAMNAADHPHGGGEGRAPIGRSNARTPWGKVAIGPHTRKNKKYSNIVQIKRCR